MKSKDNERVFIVVPVYNEGPVVRNVIKEIKKQGYKHLIVIDDGSSDNTASEVGKEKVTLLQHAINRGKGAAVKTGIEAAKILGAKYVVTIDGDGQHEPKDIHLLVQKLKNRYDVVLGSRFLKRNNTIPFSRLLGNYIGNVFTWVFYGIWVNDSQSGFRAYSKNAISFIKTMNDKYEYDSEVIKEVAKKQ